MARRESEKRTDTMGMGGSGTLMRTADVVKMATIYGGLAFLASVPGSAAERAGLRHGDIVLEVNGIPTPDMAAFVRARGERKESATVRFLRNGTEHVVELIW